MFSPTNSQYSTTAEAALAAIAAVENTVALTNPDGNSCDFSAARRDFPHFSKSSALNFTFSV